MIDISKRISDSLYILAKQRFALHLANQRSALQFSESAIRFTS